MNKKLLVLALVGAFSAPAMADVTINGTINMGPLIGTSTDATAVGQSNAVAASNGGQGFSTNGLTSNYSNVNLNSTEDIGDGNKVVFNAQLDFSNTGTTVHDTAGTLRQRNTFLGFEGNWGSLRMGINEHIYERYMYESDTMDGAAGFGGNLQMLGTPGYGNVFQVGNGGCNSGAGCAGFYRRSGQSIWYDSPDINGFTFGIAQSLNAYQGSSNGSKPSITSMGVQFKPADLPFFVNAAFERHKDMFGLQAITGDRNLNPTTDVNGPDGIPGTADDLNPSQLASLGATNLQGTSSTDTGLQIGGGATFGDISIYARYEQLKYKTDGLSSAQVHEYKRNATWLGLKYALSTGYATIQLGMAGDGSVSCGAGFGTAGTVGTNPTFGRDCNANSTGATMITGGYAHNLSKQTTLLFYGSITNNDSLASYVNIGSPSVGPGSDGRSFAVLVKHAF